MQKSKKYIIQVRGILDSQWSEWLEGLSIRHEKNITILEGEILDNSSLFGVLTKINDLNLTIISLNEVEDQK